MVAARTSGLVEAIRQVHEHCASQAGKAINVSLTLRNWVIGCYILEYEQRGGDRTDYGERLLESLSDRLQHAGMSRSSTKTRSQKKVREALLVIGGPAARLDRCRERGSHTSASMPVSAPASLPMKT
jgi:hypothetical protein